MQANSWHKIYSTSIYPEYGKAWNGRNKIQKFEYLKNGKSFLDENIFYSFWRVIIWWKNTNLIKNGEKKL